MMQQIQRRSIQMADCHLPADLPEMLRRVYHARGITSMEQMQRDLAALLPFNRLNHAEQAADVIRQTMHADGRIVVVGDFDADGATSCALAVLVIRAMGHHNIEFLVPNRFEYGYGLTPEITQLALTRQPDLIITVDNGISSHAGVAVAMAAGVKVVVTDHHLPAKNLPDATIIVNPNTSDNDFPSKSIAGVGVIFYVLLALRARFRDDPVFNAPNMADFLDLVAIGTVADVVSLDQNNRIMAYQGLRRIRAGRCRPGILALLEVAGRDYRQTQANDLGFAVGPRLNAAGRLDDMSLGITCLLAEDVDEARDLARQLDDLNRERREIEQGMQQQAESVLRTWRFEQAELAWGLCLFQADWHQGVVGILASRIKDRYHRPVIVFAQADDGLIKGSARSIPGLHIRDVLDGIATQYPDLLSRFGGHAMAAGLMIQQAHFARFSQVFDQAVRERLSRDDLQLTLLSDGVVEPHALNLDAALVIRDGGPWGQGFIEPLFDDVFDVVNCRIVGEKHWKLVLRHHSGEPVLDAIAFNQVEHLPEMPERISAAYRLDVNCWRDRQSVQLRIEALQPVEAGMDHVST